MKPAILSIDFQVMSVTPSQGILSDLERYGISPEARLSFLDYLHNSVLPRVEQLLAFCRTHRVEVVHARIQSLTQDGRERSRGHKELGLHAPPGSKEAEFLSQAAPAADEIVLNKTASGVFAATNLDYVLRNLGVTDLFVMGLYTNECISNAVRHGCDLGYRMTVVEDCCSAVTHDFHRQAVHTLKGRYARVLSAQQVLQELSAATE